MLITPRLGLLLLLVVALCDAGMRYQATPTAAPTAAVPDVSQEVNACSDFRIVREGLIPMPEGVPAAHASSLVAFPVAHPLNDQKALAAFGLPAPAKVGLMCKLPHPPLIAQPKLGMRRSGW